MTIKMHAVFYFSDTQLDIQARVDNADDIRLDLNSTTEGKLSLDLSIDQTERLIKALQKSRTAAIRQKGTTAR